MKARWATICERFVERHDGIDLIGADIDSITIQAALPAEIWLHVAVSIVVERHEFGTEGHEINIRVFEPGMRLWLN